MKNEKLFDTRLVERHIEQGLITREEYEAYLGKLEDCADKKVALDLVQPILEDDQPSKA